MKQGITVNGEIITLSGNTVKETGENHIKEISVPKEQDASADFKRYCMCKAKGRKKERKTPQAKVYYSQLIIQL